MESLGRITCANERVSMIRPLIEILYIVQPPSQSSRSLYYISIPTRARRCKSLSQPLRRWLRCSPDKESTRCPGELHVHPMHRLLAPVRPTQYSSVPPDHYVESSLVSLHVFVLVREGLALHPAEDLHRMIVVFKPLQVLSAHGTRNSVRWMTLTRLLSSTEKFPNFTHLDNTIDPHRQTTLQLVSPFGTNSWVDGRPQRDLVFEREARALCTPPIHIALPTMSPQPAHASLQLTSP